MLRHFCLSPANCSSSPARPQQSILCTEARMRPAGYRPEEPSCRRALALSSIHLHESFIIGVGVHADPFVRDDTDLQGESQREDAELFEFFQLFQRVGW